MYKRVLFFLSFSLFFISCSIKHYEHSKSKLISIKTPKLKFSDLAYVKGDEDALRVELFVAGHLVESIEIAHLICVKEGCLSKGIFNSEYLNSSYPDNILKNIILGHQIYDGKNIIKNRDGFEQTIKSEDVDIVYRVRDSSIYFKDRKNRILFKIKDIE
jgi:hypothetical protein